MLRADDGGQKPPAQKYITISPNAVCEMQSSTNEHREAWRAYAGAVPESFFLFRPHCLLAIGCSLVAPASVARSDKIRMGARAVLLLFDRNRFSLGQMQSVEHSCPVEVTIINNNK